MDDLPTLGITGGIGSGKSVVSHLLRLRGIPVYDTDVQAKRMMATDPTIRAGLVDLFGVHIYPCATGEPDRKLLASHIFGDEISLARVNALVHPVVWRDFCVWRDRVSSRGVSFCALESALMYEACLDKVCTAIVTVVAEEDVRVERARRRDNSNAEAIRSRIQVQMSDVELIRRADYVLYNEAPQLIIPQLDAILLDFSLVSPCMV